MSETEEKPEWRTDINGFYCHIMSNGKIHNQGVIIGEYRNQIIIQRFSFIDGRHTDVLIFPIKDVFNQKACRLYRTREQMIDYWEMQEERRKNKGAA